MTDIATDTQLTPLGGVYKTPPESGGVRRTRRYARAALYGRCPRCGGCDALIHVRRDSWAVCDEHRLRWPIGSNLLDSWCGQSERIWADNFARLEQYSKVPLCQ